MSSFKYIATRPDGTEATGRVEAADSDEARRLVTSQGLTVLTLVAESSETGATQSLSAAESEQLAGHLAQFGATGLPLEAGLRAAAAEVKNRRVATALNHLASQLGQGTSLEAAIADPACQLPRHVSGLVAAAARTGRLGAALSELLAQQREARSLRRDIIRGFAYSLFVVGVATAVVFVIMFGLSGVFQQMFDEFALELPVLTKLLFWWRDIGIWVVLAGVICCAMAAIATRQAVGSATWLRWLSTMPMVGRMSYWSGLAEWTGLMGLLIRYDVPLPEALRLSAGGVRNAYVGEIANSLAKATEQGKTFSAALAENRQVPASLVPVICWGERVGALAEAFSTTRELLERRVHVRSVMLRSIVPPVLFIIITCQVSALLLAIFMPLVSLIQGLS